MKLTFSLFKTRITSKVTNPGPWAVSESGPDLTVDPRSEVTVT